MPLRATGVANDVWALGDGLVLRIGRGSDEAWSDARTESVAVPAARAAGVRTPALLACDLSRSIFDAPVTVYERVHGETLGLVLQGRSDWSTALSGLGRDLARLHLRVAEVDDPHGWLDRPCPEDARAWLAACGVAALLERDELAFLERWLERLEAARAPVVPRLLHNDVHAFNVMVGADGGYLALLDWGDAGWGDPAIELATFAVDGLESLFAGYAEEAPALAGDGFPGRVLWNQVGHALRKTARPSAGRTPELGAAHVRRLAAWARGAPGPWRAWAPGG